MVRSGLRVVSVAVASAVLVSVASGVPVAASAHVATASPAASGEVSAAEQGGRSVIVRKTCAGKWQGSARFVGDSKVGVTLTLRPKTWWGDGKYYVLDSVRAFRGRSGMDTMSFKVVRAQNSTYLYAAPREQNAPHPQIAWSPNVSVRAGDKVTYMVNVRLGGGIDWAECKFTFRIP